jgi:4-amino-4-deoxy-L-arabinose transferase-like glycosyltransferase
LRLLTLWLAVVVVAISVFLGSFPLIDADEGRNAEVAREMAATNDYVMPRLNGLPYLDKPVVYFAAEAALMEVLGPTELAARLPALLFTLATAAVLFWFARKLWGAEAGLVAAIVFLSMPLTIAFARTVIFDSALTFFVVVALSALYIAVEEKRKGPAILAWASMGLAMITKGPVTFVLVLFVVIPWAWKRRGLRFVFPVWGIGVFAAVVAPWVWGVSQVVPEFLRYILVTETAERMATKALKRTGPPWYFIPYLIAGALPWSIVAIASWRALRERAGSMTYLLLWIAIPFLFFSLSQSKRPQYILPLMPAIALIVAHIWDHAKTRAASLALLILGALFLIAPVILPQTKMKPEVAAVADDVAIALGIAAAAGATAALVSKRRDVLLIALSAPIILIPALANPLMHALGERRSAKSFVAELEPNVTPQTQVIGVEAFTGSMAFYLGRPITLVTEDASELTSNYLVRRYDRLIADPASRIRPLSWLDQSLAANTERVYILRNDDHERRAQFEREGWRVVAEGAHHVGYAR